MPEYKTNEGIVVNVPDEYARARGYIPVSMGEEQAGNVAAAEQARANERGATGTLNAGITEFASGISGGLLDPVIASGLTEGERKQMARELEAHPVAGTVGNVSGMITGALLPTGPMGYLSKATGEAVEAGSAIGGTKGLVTKLGAMGTEGAVQNVGQYLGHAALEDYDVTAEGVTGAAGTGFEFGAAGGGAALGIERGTIAARRLFTRVMKRAPEVAEDASVAFKRASEDAIAANDETAAAAKKQLDEIRGMRAQAEMEAQRAKSAVRDEQARTERVRPEAEPVVPQTDNVGRAKSLEDLLPSPSAAETVPESLGGAPSKAPALSSDFGGRLEGLTQGVREDVATTRRAAGEEAATAASKQPHEAFADEVHAAAERANQKGGGFGDQKSFISSTYEEMDPALRGKSLEDFKMRLDEARRAGDIKLARADSVASMPADVVGASAMKSGPAEFHFIQLKKPVAAEVAHEVVSQGASTGLESQLATKAKLEGGTALGDMNPTVAAGLGRAPTRAMLGEKVAAQESQLEKALAEFEAARGDFLNKVANDAGNAQASRAIVRGAPGEGLAVPTDFAPAGPNVPEPGTGVASPGAMRRASREPEGTVAGKRTPAPLDDAADIAEKAKVVDRYEKAVADLADATGDAAHPSTVEQMKGYRKASDDNIKKVMARIARAADDAAEYAPRELSQKERVAYAKQQHRTARAATEQLKTSEIEAKGTYNNAVERGKELRASAPKAPEAAAPVGRGKGKLGKALDLASAFEVVGGIPGLPKPDDLPVVGPLLGAYLKYRAAKAALGHFTGRVPATGDAKAAALASRVKDRIAETVDRSLGLMEKNAATAVKYAPTVSAALSRKIYDFGQEPSEENSTQEKVAARVRELSAYVTTPGAIERDVRREMHDVADPDLIAAVEKQRRAGLEYLLDKAPKLPPTNMLAKKQVALPSPGEAMSWARRLAAVDDPGVVADAMDNHSLTLEMAETFREVYPRLHQMAVERMLNQVGKIPQDVPYRQRAMMSMLFDVPLDGSLDPSTIRVVQSVYEAPKSTMPGVPAPPGGPGPAPTPPMPSVAGDVMMNRLFQTAADRAATR